MRSAGVLDPVPITQMVVAGGVLHTPAGAGGYAAFQIPGLTTGQYTPASCSAPATWTLNPPGLGTITPDGVYTAPASVSTPQTVTLTATNPKDPTQTTSTTVTLWPGLLTNLVAVTPPYPAGTSATFQATVTNIGGTPQAGINLTFNVTGANVRSATAVTDAAGHASFTYTGHGQRPGSGERRKRRHERRLESAQHSMGVGRHNRIGSDGEGFRSC